jgi:hypothetical protein
MKAACGMRGWETEKRVLLTIATATRSSCMSRRPELGDPSSFRD